MPDFEAKDDPLRLSATGRDEQPQPLLRVVPRGRSLVSSRCRRAASAERRIGPELTLRRTSAAGRRCGRTLPTATARRRRRLWTSCHGRLDGTAS